MNGTENNGSVPVPVHSAYQLVTYYCRKWLTVWQWQQ